VEVPQAEVQEVWRLMTAQTALRLEQVVQAAARAALALKIVRKTSVSESSIRALSLQILATDYPMAAEPLMQAGWEAAAEHWTPLGAPTAVATI